jgi:3-oxoacyl-[acyl-carrier protein] reductase
MTIEFVFAETKEIKTNAQTNTAEIFRQVFFILQIIGELPFRVQTDKIHLKFMSEKQFEGKSAIVTGGTRGIGKAIVLELAKRGANVAFNYSKSADEAEKLKAEIEGFGVKALAAQCDVANTESSADFVKQTTAEFGTVDFLVNNAGITRDTLILRMKEDDWDSVIDTNLKGAWNFSKAVLRPMMKNESGGSILNISSISGVVGMLGQTNYSASKAGMIGLTKALAKEIASRKITVNALALGLIETEMASEMNAEFREKILAQIPLGRLGNVQEVAEIACFMLSDSARYITGQVIQPDGGLAM